MLWRLLVTEFLIAIVSVSYICLHSSERAQRAQVSVVCSIPRHQRNRLLSLKAPKAMILTTWPHVIARCSMSCVCRLVAMLGRARRRTLSLLWWWWRRIADTVRRRKLIKWPLWGNDGNSNCICGGTIRRPRARQCAKTTGAKRKEDYCERTVMRNSGSRLLGLDGRIIFLLRRSSSFRCHQSPETERQSPPSSGRFPRAEPLGGFLWLGEWGRTRRDFPGEAVYINILRLRYYHSLLFPHFGGSDCAVSNYRDVSQSRTASSSSPMDDVDVAGPPAGSFRGCWGIPR